MVLPFRTALTYLRFYRIHGMSTIGSVYSMSTYPGCFVPTGGEGVLSVVPWSMAVRDTCLLRRLSVFYCQHAARLHQTLKA